MSQRLGIGRDSWGCCSGKKKSIWIHAASIGEMKLASAVIREIKRDRPNIFIILTAFTDTGYETAKKEVVDADYISYLPLDLLWINKRILRRLDIILFILIEAEMWPNIMHQLKCRGSKLILLNGRITEKSYNLYSKVPFFSRNLVALIDAAGVRTRDDKERLIRLGMNSDKLYLTGNIKFDKVLTDASKISNRVNERSFFNIPDETLIVIFGCTRNGEEELLMPLMNDLLKNNKRKIIIFLAPRHVERKDEIEALLKKHGLEYSLLSSLKKGGTRKSSILLIDYVGYLFEAYSFCDIAFVGGSLLPFGGHNILEPAVFSRPVVFGSFMKNFKLEAEELLRGKAAYQVQTVKELAGYIGFLAEHPGERKKMGENGLRVIKKHQGALIKSLNLISRVLAN